MMNKQQENILLAYCKAFGSRPSAEFKVLLHSHDDMLKFGQELTNQFNQQLKTFLDWTCDEGWIHSPFENKYTNERMWHNVDHDITDEYTTNALFNAFLSPKETVC